MLRMHCQKIIHEVEFSLGMKKKQKTLHANLKKIEVLK